MNHCAQCGLEVLDGELCRHHESAFADQWAATNRAMCDLFHRGKEPVRLPEAERADELLPCS